MREFAAGLFLLFISNTPAASQGLPDCGSSSVPVCRLPATISPAQAVERLSGHDKVWWAQGDVFTVVARNSGDAVELCCSLQAPLVRLEATDLWALSVRVQKLEEAVIDVLLLPPPDAGPLRPQIWRGANSPSPPERSEVLRGTVSEHIIVSAALGEPRRVTVYMPRIESGDGTVAVVYLADGGSVQGYAGIVDALISSGKIPPVALVGDWSGPAVERRADDPDWRMQEYIAGVADGEPRFGNHQRFVANELIPWAEQNFAISTSPSDRIAAGQSNGGAWALGAVTDRASVFRKALLMSPAGREVTDVDALRDTALFVGAGTFEGELAERVSQLSQRAQNAGASVRHELLVGGHSSTVWNKLFADGLVWLLNEKL